MAESKSPVAALEAVLAEARAALEKVAPKIVDALDAAEEEAEKEALAVAHDAYERAHGFLSTLKDEVAKLL